MNGQISFFDGNKPFKFTKPVRLIELFAGIGSQAKALQRLGVDFEHYRVCEWNKYAVQSYNAIHGTEFETTDIRKLSGADLGIVETDKYQYFMTYSFPCTDLSKAGKQKGMSKGNGTRSGLLWEVERLLNETDNLPDVLMMENVPDVLSEKFVQDFYNWCNFLENIGYKNYLTVLNGKDYTIPQNRERCFMISVKGDYYYSFPESKPLKLCLDDMLEDDVDEKYYLSDEATQRILDAYMNNERKPQLYTGEESTINTLTAACGNQGNYDPYIISGDICKTIRAGGRGSTDHYSWDLVRVKNE